MSRIIQLNSSLQGSPGAMMKILSDALTKTGIINEMLITFGEDDYPNTFKYGTDAGVKMNALLSRISGRYGFCSNSFTHRLIRYLEDNRPDLVQIHTIHGHDLNLKTFFSWLKEKNIPVVYTVHDTWPFTGYCPNYDDIECIKWQSSCKKCPVYRKYSWFIDQSSANYRDKKNALTALPKLIPVTPSEWMKSQVQKSFLKDEPCIVIPNGIDTDIFNIKNTDLKNRLGIENKKMILGIANHISEAKGKRDFIELARILPEDYVMVLVGITPEERTVYPNGMLLKERTKDKRELVEYYNAADVLLNPTHGDNFPTVNLEALSCGTPVVTYRVGGSPETIGDETGRTVEFGDIQGLKDAVIETAGKKEALSLKCRKRAVEKYDLQVFKENYIQLYQSLM